MTNLKSLLVVALCASATLFAGEQRAPDPAEEQRTFEVGEGLEINLYASNPQMAKPIHMNFDPQGRLWVASSETYPQVKPGIVPNDKIILLEDTTGKGVADKATVFADKLFIPTGVAEGDGGVYVANSTELIHLKDSDGDGKADLRRTVLSGFGTEDTHHILHSFRWGMDGRLFMNQSIYIHSHVETPYGVKRLNAGGTWRLKTDTLELEVFTRGLVNHWGHCFTKWGESLATDGAGGEGVNFFFHGSMFMTGKEADGSNPRRILKGMTPGSPKFAGAELISGRHFPDDWQGDVITCDFRASRIVRFKLTEEGSGFTAKLMPDIVRVKNVKGSGNGYERAFRPIDVKMGPDGALYVADWFNPIIQHGEVDFFDPRRDRVNGRIWRITAKGRPLVERPKLVGATTESLLGQLRAPEDYTRAQARRVLIEKGAKEVLAQVPAFIQSTQNADKSSSENERLRLEALWLYQAFNQPEVALLKELLAARDPHARAGATRVLRDWHASLPDSFELLTTLINDPSPRVRLEAITALENIPHQRSLGIALRALNKPLDFNLDYALHHAANALKPHWLPAVENGAYTFDGNIAALSFALQAVGSKSGVTTLFALLKDGKIDAANQENVIGLVANMGGSGEFGELFKLQETSKDPIQRSQILSAMERGVRERKLKFAADPAALTKLFEHKDEKVAGSALRLAGAMKLEALRGAIDAVIANAVISDGAKGAAFEALAGLGGPKSIASLTEFSKSGANINLRARAAASLAALDVKAAELPAAEILSKVIDPGAAANLFAAFAKKQGAGARFAWALAKAKPAAENAEAGLRYFNASGQNEPELLKLLKSIVETSNATAHAGGANPSPNLPGKKPAELGTEISADDMKALLTDATQHGDAGRGEKVFRRKTLSCFSCHGIGGAGGQVGPDLSNVGAASPTDYIADALLLPNKTVKEGYNAVTVWTKDDEVVTGIVVRQTSSHLILRDGTRDEILIPLAEIAKKKESGSLMPSGLADSLTRGELADLLRYLIELGKQGPFSTAQSLSIRRFRLLDPTPDELANAPAAELPKLLAATQNLFWVPAYAETSGQLSISELSPAKAKPVALVRFELESSTPGKIALKFNSTKGLTGWLDGAPIDLNSGTVELLKGTRTIMLAVDTAARGNEPLKIDADEVPGSPGRFTRLGGK